MHSATEFSAKKLENQMKWKTIYDLNQRPPTYNLIKVLYGYVNFIEMKTIQWFFSNPKFIAKSEKRYIMWNASMQSNLEQFEDCKTTYLYL